MFETISPHSNIVERLKPNKSHLIVVDLKISANIYIRKTIDNIYMKISQINRIRFICWGMSQTQGDLWDANVNGAHTQNTKGRIRFTDQFFSKYILIASFIKINFSSESSFSHKWNVWRTEKSAQGQRISKKSSHTHTPIRTQATRAVSAKSDRLCFY